MNGRVCTVCGREEAKISESDYGILKPGTEIDDGSVVIGAKIGRGGFGITYHALDTISGNHIVVKEFMPKHLVNRAEDGKSIEILHGAEEAFQESRRSFMREANVLHALRQQPNIVNVLFTVDENQTAYYGMEYLDGENLSQWARNRKKCLSAKEACELLLPIMDALIYCHEQGVFHRDISPDNIFLVRHSSEKYTPKLIDFGAAYIAIENFTHTYPNVRKQCYSPLEQMTRGVRQGSWSDVYSFAATVYYLICGKPPASAMDIASGTAKLLLPSEQQADISSEAENILMHALALNCEGRIQTMREFRDSFCQVLHVTSEKAKEESIRNESTEVVPEVSSESKNTDSVPSSISIPVEMEKQRKLPDRTGLRKRFVIDLMQFSLFYGLGYLLLGFPGLLVGWAAFAVFQFLLVFSGSHATAGMNAVSRHFMQDGHVPTAGASLIYALFSTTPMKIVDAVMLFRGEKPFGEALSGLDSKENDKDMEAIAEKPLELGEHRAVLLCMDGAMKGKHYSVHPGDIAGRNPEEAQIVLDPADGMVSRKHCRFEYQESRNWGIVDLSSNGIKINGKALPSRNGKMYPIADKTRIQIGTSNYEFHVMEKEGNQS